MKKQRIVSNETFGRRVIQISMDIEIPESANGDNVATEISNMLMDTPKFLSKGYYVAGATFSEDMTDEYVKYGWFDE